MTDDHVVHTTPWMDHVVHTTPWMDLGTSARSFSLAPTLLSGMSFRWARHTLDAGETFTGVLCSRIFELRTDPEGAASCRCHYTSPPPAEEAMACMDMLRTHLRLDDDALFSSCDHVPWLHGASSCAAIARFRAAALALPGVRVLRILDLLECVVTFMGSANNNIKRCCQMVSSLCAAFPENSLGFDVYGTQHFRFPTVAQLTTLPEARLWELGWGYRAPRLVKLASQLAERGGEGFLEVRCASPSFCMQPGGAHPASFILHPTSHIPHPTPHPTQPTFLTPHPAGTPPSR